MSAGSLGQVESTTARDPSPLRVGSLRVSKLDGDIARSRAALTAVFFLLGLLMGSWAARIPAVKSSLHLSSASLGLALLGPAAGLIISTFPTGLTLARHRARPTIAAGIVVFVGSMPLVARAGSAPSLFVVLLVWGVGSGIIDVAMNTEAAAVQARAPRPIMTGMHAAFSIGALSGAGIGAAAATAGVSVGWHLLMVSAAATVIGALAVASLPHGDRPVPLPPTEGRRAKHLPPPSWRLAALAAVAFGGFLAEGSTTDWSAVYVHASLRASSGFAALAYTSFAVAMTCGRLVGDRLGHRYGPVRLIRISTACGATAFGASLLASNRFAALAGFAVLGLGLSVLIPQVFAASASVGPSSGPSVALVTACGYVGLMVGPPMIGWLAELVGLPNALAAVVVAAGLACLLSGCLSPAGDTDHGYHPPRGRSDRHLEGISE